ncbi:TetR/AcrR family transcriptional regulator [Zavarzinia compransoris]|uniref:TetR/AcrR family transcriptional regulator n=1 Tax=Zavarzinia marina TaxID=2911065 RepID=UPI001F1A53F6|nr:TetR/AcrR family transcriptional regulator [Zavarzinia marina]MCF4164564.1 TetR/AcrR family transcriptional regulator [Zavarzinia marina]
MAIAALGAGTDERGTRQAIVEATLRCIRKFSQEKTGISAVAREARVTRATVYSYFPTREDMLHAALLQVVVGFVARLTGHLAGIADPESRLVEAMAFICREIPRDRYLSVIAEPSMAEQVYDKTLTAREGEAIRLDVFRAIMGGGAKDGVSLEDRCEIYTRLVVSMLTLKTRDPRDEDDLRGFFRSLVSIA